MHVDAVFFDAGNTILYPDPPVGQVYAAALQRAGVSAPVHAVQARFEKVFSTHPRPANPASPDTDCAGAMRDWWKQIVRETFAPFGTVDGFDELFDGLWEHFAVGSAWKLYEDVLPTFESLRGSGRSVGLISNWDARLEGILDELDLRTQLDWKVISYEVGAEKPDAAVFRRALDMCGLPPDRVAHIGDSYLDDVVGARNAGMHAVWLQRNGNGHTEVDVPVVQNLHHLLQLLNQP
jgi:putative hydrolase of the HAD superfamily